MSSQRSRIFVIALVATLVATAPAAAVSQIDKKQNKQIKALKKTTAALLTDLNEAKANLNEAKADLATLDATFQGHVDSSEYGVVVVYFDPEGDGFEANDAVTGGVLTTGDIPDNADQATVSGTLTVMVPDGTTAKPIALKAGIRSGENDGTGASDPSGQAGLVAMGATMIGAPGTTSIGGGNPGTSGLLPISSAPNGTLSGKPLYDIAVKSDLASAQTSPLFFPDGLMIELTDPSRLQTLTGAPGRFTVTNTSGGPAAALFNVTVRFTDLSTSETDLEE